MRIVKNRLIEMMPGVQVFLDVDDLKTGAGAEYIDRSSVVLAYCTRKCERLPGCTPPFSPSLKSLIDGLRSSPFLGVSTFQVLHEPGVRS